MFLPLVLAILSPLFYGAASIVQKYIFVRKVRYTWSFVPLIGLTEIIIALCIGLFLDWSNFHWSDLIFPCLIAVCMGVVGYIYFGLMKDHDISHIIGIMYVYPVVVALLSFLFLREVIPIIGYLGMMFAIAGVLMLSLRMKRVKNTAWLILIFFIFAMGLTEFFVKMTTTKITPLHGIVISYILVGLIFCGALLSRTTRNHFPSELHNFKYAVFSELVLLAGYASIFYAMAGLPATVVASIASVEPLFVLFMERMTVHTFIGRISKDHLIMPKLGSIVLVVIGVFLLYASQLF